MKIIYDKAVLPKIGVYKIELGNHFYIGHTGVSFKQRWDRHVWNFINLKCNRKFKLFLRGNSTIKFSMIKECYNKNEAIAWETYYINELQPDLNVKMK